MRAYCELDCLLDMRTATLNRFFPDLVESIVCDERYWYRPNDNLGEIFEGIDNQTFLDHYADRDHETLLHSTITEIPGKLREVVLERKVLTSTSTKPIDAATLIVNFYPFDLNEALSEALLTQIKIETGFDAIKRVYLEPRYVTPAFLHGCDPVILYDMELWLKHHAAELSQRPLPGQSFKVPLLIKQLPSTPEELTFNMGATQEVMKAALHYDPQPISMFCFDDPSKK